MPDPSVPTAPSTPLPAQPTLADAYRPLAALPLPLRRRLVRHLFTVRDLTRRLTGRRSGFAHAELYQRLLRVPQREARALAFETRLHDVAAEVEWLALHTRAWTAIRRDMEHVRFEDAATLASVAGTGRPVILAPLHMGAYVVGLGCTMLRFFPDRRLLILRQRADQAMETGVMERMREVGVDLRFLQVERRADFLAAVRFARGGAGRAGAVIVIFCDLPPAYGAPASMPLFGLPTRFAFGLDAFARLTDATVVPWFSAMEPDGDVIRTGRPFEAGDDTPGDRARRARLVRDHIRAALCNHPEQWHLWCTLSDYLPAPATVMPDPASRGADPLPNAA